MNLEVIRFLQKQNSNNYCFECQVSGTQWVSLNHGIFLCQDCADLHEYLGIHISWLKFIDEPWSNQQTAYIKLGGNNSFSDFLHIYGLNNAPLPEKYYSNAAEYYRQLLRARANGKTLSYYQPSVAEGLELFMEPPPIQLHLPHSPSSGWVQPKKMLGSAWSKASQLVGSSASMLGSVTSGAAKVYSSGRGLVSYLGKKVSRAPPQPDEPCPQPAGKYYKDVDET